VQHYRRRYSKIPKAWEWWRVHLPRLCEDSGIWFGPVKLEKEAILLPSGLRLFYPALQFDAHHEQWMCTIGGKPKRLFGGKMYENVVQALSRIITMGQAARLQQMFPRIRLAHQVHDDLVYVVRHDMAAEFKHALREEMSTERDWYVGLPLDAEAAEGPNYGDAK
jgi:hypothetical protein